MRIHLLSSSAELQGTCRGAINDLPAGSVEFLLVDRFVPGKADVFLWDVVGPPMPAVPKGPDGTLHLVAIDQELLDSCGAQLLDMRVPVLLKPVPRQVLRPFLAHVLEHGDSKEPCSIDCLLAVTLQMQRYERTRSDFLARAARELSSPLSALNAYCGLLLDSGSGSLNPVQADLVQRMSRSIRRTLRIASGLWNVAQPESLVPGMSSPANLEPCVREALADCRPLFDEKQIAVTVVIEDPVSPLPIASARVHQVVVSLLEYASRYCPAGGNVAVSAYPATEGYRIDIRDSGPAVPSQLLDSLFEEGGGAGNTQSRAGCLSLVLSKRIITNHSGRIWASSGANGFTVSLVFPQLGGRSDSDPEYVPAAANYGSSERTLHTSYAKR